MNQLILYPAEMTSGKGMGQSVTENTDMNIIKN